MDVGWRRLERDRSHARRSRRGVERDRERVVSYRCIGGHADNSVDLLEHLFRLLLAHVKFKGAQRLRDLIEIDRSVDVGVDHPEDLFGRAVHRNLLGEYLHDIRRAQLGRLIKLHR